MNGSGKGGNNRRRPFKRRERDSDKGQNGGQNNGQFTQNSSQRGGKKAGVRGTDGDMRRDGDGLRRYEKNPGAFFDRPKWVPPQLSTEPIPAPDCPYCGKPIRDMSTAITDKGSGAPVHFDCVIARLAEGEILEPGDTVTYIGGGRFGVVQFPNPSDSRNFKIKKIVEWEDKENRADWRKDISDHYSIV
ncbi:hypothetical protein AGMMS50268_02800 [Spirochaetia bacterium]|nr:hypothetical protein AGMMS50268_02800 [Spirochaetia bacterium]